MAQAREERDTQQSAEQDMAVKEPTADEPSTKMTGSGNIPPVMNGFADAGPSASDRAYGNYVRVQASTLNVRAEPTTESKIVGKLHRGKLVEQRGQVGDWVQIRYGGGTAFVHGKYVEQADTRPSKESSDEVMQMFREVNGEEGRGAPPSKEDSAEVMQMFREVNGEQGRGAPPSKESMAEVMNDFREVNGEQGRGAPPSKEASAEVMQMFREVNGEPGRGAPPSKESMAEVMKDFREVNGEPGRGAPPKLSDEERQKLLDDLE